MLDNPVIPILGRHDFPLLDNHIFPILDNHVCPILDVPVFTILDNHVSLIFEYHDFPILDKHDFPILDNPVLPIWIILHSHWWITYTTSPTNTTTLWKQQLEISWGAAAHTHSLASQRAPLPRPPDWTGQAGGRREATKE